MWMAVLIGIVVIGAVIITVVSMRSENGNKLSKQERLELTALRNCVASIDDLAFQHRELDSLLAPQILDEIRKTRRTINP